MEIYIKNEKLPLLSIIVPVYNVQDYLEECCNSIINQKYLNIEILLIDDGSTDNSGEICDYFGEKYSNIRVFHRENEGLAATRNFGIAQAQGQYLGFVDSDDWIYENMYSDMMKIVLEKTAQIVCCNFDLEIDKRIIKRGKNGIDIYNKNEAIVNLMYPQFYQFYAPNKIFKKELFQNVEFPIGKHFEDIITIYKVFLKSEKVYFIWQSGYVYRQRKDSITNAIFNSKSAEVLDAIGFVMNDSKRRFPNNINDIMVGYIRYYISFLDKAIIGNSKELRIYQMTIQDVIKKYKKAIIINKKLSFARKIQFLVCGYFAKLYELLAKIKNFLN